MATDAVPASDLAIEIPVEPAAVPHAAERDAFERPYAPSWVNVLIDHVEALPGPTWLAYTGLAAIVAALSVLAYVSAGKDTLEDMGFQAFWGVFLAITLWLVQHLATVAASALAAFRPALTVSDAEVARLRYELAVVPARPALVLTVITAVATPLYYMGDPVGAQVVGLTPLAMVGRYLSEVLFGSLVVVLVYHSLRQLRRVGRIHAEATRVDLFRPAPLYAFSVLTSRTAMVIALVFILPTIVVAAQQQGDALGWWIWAPYVAVGIVAAAAVFVLPLRGMQRRILAEKRRLQGEVGLRIETTIAAIHRSVDAGEIAEASKMNDALSALITERELVDKLPTLPWRPGTLGGLITAIALPLGLFVATRLLERAI